MNNFKIKFTSMFLIFAALLNLVHIKTNALTKKYGKYIENKKSIEATHEKIKNISNNKKQLQKAEKDLSNKMKNISDQIDELDKQIKKLQEQLEQKQNELNTYRKEIDKNNDNIKQIEEKIQQIGSSLTEVKDFLLQAIRKNYIEFKSGSMIEHILNSENISEFMKNTEYLKRQSAYDKEVIDNFTTQINNMEKLKLSQEKIKKRNADLEKLCLDTLNSLRKDEREINDARKEKMKNLDILENNLKNIKSKEQFIEKIRIQLEEAKKALQLQQIKDIQEAKQPKAKSEPKIKSEVLPNVNNNTLLCFPLPSGRISSGFGPRRDGFHHGIDIRAPRRTPVYAAGNGVVTFAGSSGYGQGHGGYGICIDISHGNNTMTRYAHLDSIAAGVKNGTKVQKGKTVIGYVGHTGAAGSVDHLHFEVIVNNRKTNPTKYF